MIGIGVPVGANTPTKFGATRSVKPCSTAVGSSGAAVRRVPWVTARTLSLPARCSSSTMLVGGHDHGNLAGEDVGDRRPRAAVGHVDEIGDADPQLEGFGGEVIERARTGGAIGQLARIGLGIGD